MSGTDLLYVNEEECNLAFSGVLYMWVQQLQQSACYYPYSTHFKCREQVNNKVIFVIKTIRNSISWTWFNAIDIIKGWSNATNVFFFNNLHSSVRLELEH